MRDLDQVAAFVQWCRDNGVDAVEVGDVKVRFGPLPIHLPPLEDVLPPPRGPEPEVESIDDETLATWSSPR